MLSGFAATANWSNLPLKPEFVPMFLRTIAYLQRQANAFTSTSVAPSQPALIRLTDRWPDARVQSIDPSGKSHKVELHRNGRSLVGAMLQTNQKGFYTFQVFPHTEDASERSRKMFRKNYSKLLTSQADPNAIQDAQLLWWNMKHQVCLGNKIKSFC